MFKNLNMKKLAGIFAILLVTVVIITIYDSGKGEKTFKSDLATLDTSNITSIMFFPKADKKGIKLLKEGKEWKVLSNGKSYTADKNLIAGILNSVAVIKAERVAATDKSMWKDYEITDSAGTKVIIDVNNKKAVEFVLGKFSYKQVGQGFSMSSYVRLEGEPEVYSVQGQMNMYFNRDVNSYRDKTLMKAKAEDFTNFTFTYPGDSSFTLSNINNSWKINGQEADSMKVKNYLNTMANCSGYNFADEKTSYGNTPVYTLKIEGKNFPVTEIKAFPADSINKFVITSTMNKEALFTSGQAKLAERVFEGKEKFLPAKK